MQAFKSNIIEANDVIILLHGGVGRIHKEAISPETEHQYKEAIIHALTEGQKIISCSGKSIDAEKRLLAFWKTVLCLMPVKEQCMLIMK